MARTYRKTPTDVCVNFSDELADFVLAEIEDLDRDVVQSNTGETERKYGQHFPTSIWFVRLHRQFPVLREEGHTGIPVFETAYDHNGHRAENELWSWKRPKAFRNEGNRKRRNHDSNKLQDFVNHSYTRTQPERYLDAEALVFEEEDKFWEWYH